MEYTKIIEGSEQFTKLQTEAKKIGPVEVDENSMLIDFDTYLKIRAVIRHASCQLNYERQQEFRDRRLEAYKATN